MSGPAVMYLPLGNSLSLLDNAPNYLVGCVIHNGSIFQNGNSITFLKILIIGGAAPPGCPSIAESAVTGINSKFKETLYISKFSLLDSAPQLGSWVHYPKEEQSFLQFI